MLLFQPMRALESIRDHATFKLPCDFSYQMKTPFECLFRSRLLLDFYSQFILFMGLSNKDPQSQDFVLYLLLNELFLLLGTIQVLRWSLVHKVSAMYSIFSWFDTFWYFLILLVIVCPCLPLSLIYSPFTLFWVAELWSSCSEV